MMSEETPVTRHVHECVKLLNQYLHARSLHLVQQGLQEDSDALEAVFEVVDNPWDEASEGEELFREGYETCLLDVVEAIANEWGVELPKLKVT
jgi:hypothetical protein